MNIFCHRGDSPSGLRCWPVHRTVRSEDCRCGPGPRQTAHPWIEPGERWGQVLPFSQHVKGQLRSDFSFGFAVDAFQKVLNHLPIIALCDTLDNDLFGKRRSHRRRMVVQVAPGPVEQRFHPLRPHMQHCAKSGRHGYKVLEWRPVFMRPRS